MPVAETTPLSATLQRVRFAQSPKMSTYLLFVGVGDFERIHQTVDGVDVGVVVKRGDTPKAAYALDQAGKILHYYNQYFGVAYPLPKLDLIAAPGQISGGSMENWGAIFYSQNHLFVRSEELHGGGPPTRIPGRGPRNGSPMVRRLGHHGLVGQSVAERGLRTLDADFLRG